MSTNKKMEWYERLVRPFEWGEIEVKVQAIKDNYAFPVAYFDARLVRRRLTEVFGPMGWTADFSPLFSGNQLAGVVCTLRCTTPTGELMERIDVGTPSAIEPVKGAYSDALKRAFAATGCDWLYDVSLGRHPYSGNKGRPFEEATLQRIRQVYEAQVEARVRAHPVVIVDPGTPEELELGTDALKERLGVRGDARGTHE